MSLFAWIIFCCFLLPYHFQVSGLGEYRGCRDPAIGFIPCRNGVYPWDPYCTYFWSFLVPKYHKILCATWLKTWFGLGLLGQRIHGEYPFACYGHQCSPENEAYFLGKTIADSETDPTAPRFIFGDNFNRTDLMGIFRKFVRMEGLADDSLEKLDPPENDGTLGNKFQIPRVCDPRFHLYCDSSYLRHTTERDVKSICKCHPFYSLRVETSETNSRGDKLFQCFGRPGVPCGYEENSTYLSELIDYQFNSNTKKEDLEDSRCVRGATCVNLEDSKYLARNGSDFVKDYRAGKIYHGFGISPIMAKYMLQTVNRICVCDNRKMWTVMHDCV